MLAERSKRLEEHHEKLGAIIANLQIEKAKQVQLLTYYQEKYLPFLYKCTLLIFYSCNVFAAIWKDVLLFDSSCTFAKEFYLLKIRKAWLSLRLECSSPDRTDSQGFYREERIFFLTTSKYIWAIQSHMSDLSRTRLFHPYGSYVQGIINISGGQNKEHSRARSF